MHFSALYIQAQNKALSAFTDLTRTDLIILLQLALINYPVQHYVLYNAICNDYAVISRATFQHGLDTLNHLGAITRKPVSSNTIYAITGMGKELIKRFNNTLECIVSEQVRKYGNGL